MSQSIEDLDPTTLFIAKVYALNKHYKTLFNNPTWIVRIDKYPTTFNITPRYRILLSNAKIIYSMGDLAPENTQVTYYTNEDDSMFMTTIFDICNIVI